MFVGTVACVDRCSFVPASDFTDRNAASPTDPKRGGPPRGPRSTPTPPVDRDIARQLPEGMAPAPRAPQLCGARRHAGVFESFRDRKNHSSKSRLYGQTVRSERIGNEKMSSSVARGQFTRRSARLVRLFDVRDLYVSRSTRSSSFSDETLRHVGNTTGAPSRVVAPFELKIMSDDCTSRFATSSAAGFGFGSLIGALNATWQVHQRRIPFVHHVF